MGLDRILVTGATGFVGRALRTALSRAGRDVIAAVRHENTTSALACPTVAVGDIDAATDWRRALSGVDGVVHEFLTEASIEVAVENAHGLLKGISS